MAVNLKKFLCVGPGGMNCNCCFPPRGSRRYEFRRAKKKSLRDAIKHEVEAEYNDEIYDIVEDLNNKYGPYFQEEACNY